MNIPVLANFVKWFDKNLYWKIKSARESLHKGDNSFKKKTIKKFNSHYKLIVHHEYLSSNNKIVVGTRKLSER